MNQHKTVDLTKTNGNSDTRTCTYLFAMLTGGIQISFGLIKMTEIPEYFCASHCKRPSFHIWKRLDSLFHNRKQQPNLCIAFEPGSYRPSSSIEMGSTRIGDRPLYDWKCNGNRTKNPPHRQLRNCCV